ncbi:hypothetical protein BDV12DRAFT_203438 [Aspergillus spectabilis]
MNRLSFETKSVTQYSASVYTPPETAPPDERPGTPNSFDCFILFQGGETSATDMATSAIQRMKTQNLTQKEEYNRAIYEASRLRAENAWLRENRKAALSLSEGVVEDTIELLRVGSAIVHDALLQFHIAFGAIDLFMNLEKGFESDLTQTLLELIPAFEKCREGLGRLQSALEGLEKGHAAFTNHIAKSNTTYAGFFGIDYAE